MPIQTRETMEVFSECANGGRRISEGVVVINENGGTVHLFEPTAYIPEGAYKFDTVNINDRANFVLMFLRRIDPSITDVYVGDTKATFKNSESTMVAKVISGWEEMNGFSADCEVHITMFDKRNNYTRVANFENFEMFHGIMRDTDVVTIPDYRSLTKNPAIQKILEYNQVTEKQISIYPRLVQTIHESVLRGATTITDKTAGTMWKINKYSLKAIKTNGNNHKSKRGTIFIKVPEV